MLLPEYPSTKRSFDGHNMSIIVGVSLFSVCRVLKQSRVSSSLNHIRPVTSLASDGRGCFKSRERACIHRFHTYVVIRQVSLKLDQPQALAVLSTAYCTSFIIFRLIAPTLLSPIVSTAVERSYRSDVCCTREIRRNVDNRRIVRLDSVSTRSIRTHP